MGRRRKDGGVSIFPDLRTDTLSVKHEALQSAMLFINQNTYAHVKSHLLSFSNLLLKLFAKIPTKKTGNSYIANG